MPYILFRRLFIGIYLASLSIETADTCILQCCSTVSLHNNHQWQKGNLKLSSRLPSVLVHTLTSLLRPLQDL